MKSGTMILLGILGLVITGIGVADLLTVNPYSYVQGEDDTINYYLFIGIPLIILGIAGVIKYVREQKERKSRN